jgi:hypothetical protein
MLDIVHARLVKMPNRVVRKSHNRESHTSRHLTDMVSPQSPCRLDLKPYLSEALRLGVLLKTESRKVDAVAEDFSFSQDTDTTNTVDLHFHVGVAIRVPKISQMRAPRRILCVTLHDDRILVESVREGQGGL